MSNKKQDSKPGYLPYAMRLPIEKPMQTTYLILALLAVFAFSMYGYLIFQMHYANPIPKLTLLTPNYYLYDNGTLICQRSAELYTSSAVTNICTDTFVVTNNSINTTPHSIALFYFTFSSQNNASSYINNVIEFLNTTPWPNNIAALGQAQEYNNVKIYETTTVIHDPTNYTRVNTIYAQLNNRIIGVSSLSSSSSFVSAENFDEQLLYKWYLTLNNNSV